MKFKLLKQYISTKEPTIPLLPIEFYEHPPKVVAIDTECTGLRWFQNDRIFSIGLVFDWNNVRHSYLYSFPVNPFTRIPIYNEEKGLNQFKNWIWKNPRIIKVLANAKYDWHMFVSSFGPTWEPKGEIHDVLLMAWCCNTLEASYSLDSLSKKYLKSDRSDVKKLRDLVIKLRAKAKKEGFNCGPQITDICEDYWLVNHYYEKPNLLSEYNLKDCSDTLDLYYFYKEGLEQLNVRKTYEIELRVMKQLYLMEKRGIRLHEDIVLEKINEIEKESRELEFSLQQQVISVYGKPINLNSDKQLRIILYDKDCFNLPVIRRTEITGEPACDTQTFIDLINLTKGQPVNQFLRELMEWKGRNKSKDFCRQYVDFATKDTQVTLYDLPWLHEKKCIHGTFNQLFAQGDYENKTRTGRLSSSNPNMHNIAKPETSKSHEAHYIVDARSFFGPREGYYLYIADYPQIELRIFAARLGPKSKLYQAFMENRDPHDETRLAIPYLRDMEDKKYARQLGKHTNFTVINCGGKYALNNQYGIPLEQGEILIDSFYREIPEARKRQIEAEQFAIQNGYIETITGRKINVNLEKDFQGRYKYAYRATSYDIQGSAADFIKLAMIELQDWFDKLNHTYEFKPKSFDVNMLLQVHDELVFEIYKYHTYKWLLKGICTIMENVVKRYIPFPIKVELKKSLISWSGKDQKQVLI